jgi:hypothetical protein
MSPCITSGARQRRGKGRQSPYPEEASGTVEALHGVLNRLGSGGSEMSQDKKLDMLKYIASAPPPPAGSTEMQKRAYSQLCAMVIDVGT